MSPRLLCCGDLHVGAGRGLYPERLAEQQAVWQRILDLAVERECDAVLFAGDAFHRNHPDDDERHAFMQPLIESGVPVIAINGNSHDWRGIGKRMAVETAAIGNETLIVSTVPEILNIVRGAFSIDVMRDLSVPGGVYVATLPWTPVARLVADHGGGDRDDINVVAAELLVETARGLRGQVDGPAILLGHWSVSGASLPTGLDVGLLREPVLPIAELEQLGFDAIVMGHIHAPQRLGMHPAAFYCGSPMPLDYGEGASSHGVWIVDDEDGQWGAVMLPIPSTGFHTLTLDGVARYAGDVAAGSCVRVKDTVPAGSDVDLAEIRRSLLERGAKHVQIAVDVEPAARRARGVEISEDHGPAELLDQWLRDVAGVNGAEGGRLVDRGRTYLEGVS